MSTTDTRAAFEAWMREEYGADDDMLKRPYEDRYFWPRAADAWAGWQAATEAAKATGTAGELPPLPESQADGDSTCDFHGRLFAYTAEDMREYGQACAEAAWNNCATLNQERIRQLTDAEAARQPAPVVVKPWETRMQEYFAQGSVKMRTPASFMADEIIDSRAALAATAAPVLSDDLQMKLKACIETCRVLEILSRQEADALLAATNRSQP